MTIQMTKKMLNKYLMLAISGMLVLGFSGCKKETTDDDDASTGGSGATVESDYIQNGSSKVEFTDPTIGTYSKNVQGEDNYAWTGNAPGNQYSLTLNQAIARKEGSVVASGWSGSMIWGNTNMALSGTYTLSKDANGKWVSTFIGQGSESVGTGGATTVYPGIAFKVTWPQ